MDIVRELLEFTPSEQLDEGQRRMTEAALAILEIPSVHAKIHEYDAECQPPQAKYL